MRHVIYVGAEHEAEPGGRGGEGGKGGHGGYRGAIVIENVDDRDPSIAVHDAEIGEENHQPVTEIIIQINHDGPCGTRGVDGNGGLDGESHSIDVGFMDRADENYKPVYFGFNQDVNITTELTVNYYTKEPSEPYVKCKNPDEKEVLFAKIEEVAKGSQQKVRQTEKNEFRIGNIIQRKAAKKKAITRQSLYQHLAHIAKWNGMTKTIDTILSPLMEQSGANGINESINVHLLQNQQQEGLNRVDSNALSVKNVSSERVPSVTSPYTNTIIPVTNLIEPSSSPIGNCCPFSQDETDETKRADSGEKPRRLLKPQLLI